MSDTAAGLVQLAVLVAALAFAYRPLGDYLAAVYGDERHWRVERVLYRLFRVTPDAGQRWSVYATAVLAFSLVSIVALWLLQRLQPLLPGGGGRGAVDPGTAFNTAVSFVTNTNWQSYVPEQAMGAGVSMLGLTVQNFLSAAVGMAVAAALIRGFARSEAERIGNFWVDLTRGTVRVLLPIAAVSAVVLVALGVVQSLRVGLAVRGPDGAVGTVPMAPAASQEAIKELGTNGGGVYNANSAHPFENPSAATSLLETFLLLVIPVSLTRALGVLVGDRRQGYTLLAVMATLASGVLAVTWLAEGSGAAPASRLAGAAMEGKESRFGVALSSQWATATTGTSTGAVNAMHDSYTGLGGGAPLLHMLLGEVSPGGVGVGIYGILVLAVIAMFLAGLMVGRTPEYLGKRLGRREITASAIAVLTMPTVVLLLSGAALALPATREAMTNHGAHGLTEVLYAYASAGNNNGSAMTGLTVTSGWFQSTLGVAMLLGRFVPMVAVLALAGSLVGQRRVPATAGTLPTASPLFAAVLGATVVLVAALTFVPALALGPIAEALA